MTKNVVISSYEQVKKWINTPAMQEVVSRSLPAGVNSGSWTEAALAYVRTAKDIQNCDPLSIMGALIIIASFGLRLDGVMGHAYLRALAIKEKGKIIGYDAQVQLGYKGMVELAYRNSDVQDVEPVIVYQHDKFDFRKGTDPYLHHTWSIDESRGEMKAVYAGLRFRNGYYAFQIHNIADIMELRKNILEQSWIRIENTEKGVVYRKKKYNSDWYTLSAKEANQYPWIGHLVPMVLKTAIRWSQKYWPTVGTDFSKAASLVELDDAGISQGMSNIASEKMPVEMRRQAEINNTETTTTLTMARGKELTQLMAAEALKDNTEASGDKQEGEKDNEE